MKSSDKGNHRIVLTDAETFLPPAPLEAAVLFLIFNRPDTTARVMEAIRRARPPRLYIAADGARPHKIGESQKLAEVLRIATTVDWPCEVRTLIRDTNLGCKKAVSEAVSWFFDCEQQGIILEDDCLPSQSFFWFCETLLKRYAEDARVMTIGGSNFQRGKLRGDGSYFATKHFHCWGWASWRRAWQEYKGDLSFSTKDIENGLSVLSDGNPMFARYWRQILRACREQKNSSWAYPMTLTCFARRGAGRETFHLAPQANLVANIGFGQESTHTSMSASNPAPTAQELAWPLQHPTHLQRSILADRMTDRTVFRITWHHALKRELKGRFQRLRALVRSN